MNFPTRSFFSLTLAWFCLSQGANADWPMIRGSHGTGHATGTSILAHTSTQEAPNEVKLKVRWKTPLGSGYSSVVVAGQIAVTGFSDDQSGYVAGFDTQTGNEVWRHRTGPKYAGVNGSYDGPVATPAIGFGLVFAMSPTGEVFALDLKTGAPKWHFNAIEKFKVQPGYYGMGSSPIIHRQHVLFTFGSPLGTIVALDPQSGEIAWSSGNDAVAYQNPVATTLGGKPVLLATGDTTYAVLDAENGNLLLEQKHGGAGARGAWSLVPVPLNDHRVFYAHDDTSSIAVDFSNHPSQQRIHGQTFQAKEAWNERTIRNSYNVPVVANDLLFAFSSRILTCVDFDGQLKWRSRGLKDGFLSVVDGHLVTLTKSGTLHIGTADAEGYQDLTKTKVFDGTTWSIPAIDGDAIYVRSLTEIARVDIVPGNPAPQTFTTTEQVGPQFKGLLDQVAKASDKNAVVDKFFANVKTTPLIEGDIVHFVFRGPQRDVAVASDLFGARQERPMIQVPGTDLSYFAAKIPNDTRASYVFIADYDTIPDPKNSRKVKSSLLVEDIEMQFLNNGETLEMSWFDMPKRNATLEPDPSKSLVGQLSDFQWGSPAMNGEVIKLSAYTPPHYKAAGPQLPVVFVHDAQYAITSRGFPQIVESLIQRKQIPETVVVFIHRSFNPLLGANGYEKMFGEELIPLIERKFHVSSDRNQRSSLGAGFGGLLAKTSTLSHRNLVGKLVMQSPYMFDFHQPMVDAALTVDGPPVTTLVHWGTYELTNPVENWDMAITAQRSAKQLAAAGHPVTTAAFNDGADWICWRTRMEDSLRFLLTETEHR